ncbi:tetratricopeptide repeat protein [Colwellia psychrerythraea]|uniref:Sel1 domain protein repeat-containing protein n=1 Tax=Colwellia psychrerythraea TaxID=28229 RepID=A0A099KKA3_COLPS|nr:sel1 repeat family protein [Colwellia psychrerythraea]KGJ90670.1 Sel1 domain protein repeat-containing protein [Colwellia psychrerythraea]
MDKVNLQKGIERQVKNKWLASWITGIDLSVANTIKVIAFISLCLFIYNKSTQSQQENDESSLYLSSPKINDIYFLDFRLLSDSLRPKQKYRIAKVVDITGDIVTLLYGNMFYLRQQSLKDSIRYGQLRFKDYFETKRYDLPLVQLESMYDSKAIYMIKRPDQNMLYGNYINEPESELSTKVYIPGKRENLEGLSLLKSNYLENNLQQAFQRFSQSAQFGFAEGQVNLAQMYLNAQYLDKDLEQAMFWFKQAALQSSKAGVLKYVIVCRQVSYCQEGDFYQELSDAGVNIKVRALDFKLN